MIMIMMMLTTIATIIRNTKLYIYMYKWMWVKMEDLADHKC